MTLGMYQFCVSLALLVVSYLAWIKSSNKGQASRPIQEFIAKI